MPGESLTNKPVTEELKDSSYVVVSQNEDVDGELKQALRRIPTGVLQKYLGVDELKKIAALIPLGNGDGYVPGFKRTELKAIINTEGELIDVDPEYAYCVCYAGLDEHISEYVGETLYVSGACCQTAPLCVFKDCDGNVIGKDWGNGAEELTVVREYPVVVPANAETIYVNQLRGQNCSPELRGYFKKVVITDENLSDDVKELLKNLPNMESEIEELQGRYEYSGQLVKPNNLIPQNADEITKNGVTVTLVDNVITVSGTWNVTWNDYCYLGTIPLTAGRYYLQLWDIDGDTSSLVGAAVNATTLRNNVAEGSSVATVITEDGDISFGVRVFPEFTGTASFKLTLSQSVLEAYEPTFDPYEEITSLTLKDEHIPEKVKMSGNNLYGKKWAVCGDSFSHGDFNNAPENNYTITEGKYAGEKKVYGYLIGNRNNMEIQHLALGGRTMATPSDGSFTNAFSNEIYKTIDSDVDYITLYFGINDSHHRPDATGSDGEDTTGVIPLGTIDDTDTSTFYGAWNVVLEYLIKNYPNAHIGIIVSNGCETHDYPTAEIELAKKWGIPYIDLNGDERTPAMLRSTNPDICDALKDARLQAQAVNLNSGSINKHPNAAAHEYQSVFIENWLRTL